MSSGHAKLREVRCTKCAKLLFKTTVVNGVIEIHCARCKKIRTVKFTAVESPRAPLPNNA